MFRCAAWFKPIHTSYIARRLQWNSAVETAKVQSYISSHSNPFLNLSIEHYLLQSTPPDSVVLFIYRNEPSVVFGRNQNPWLELDLKECLERQRKGQLHIVRRRSGGGTVFHSLENVNWTVISPPATFTRDKHAEMVVKALRTGGVHRARVNQRHDIVLDQGTTRQQVEPDDMHRTPWTSPNGPQPLKCSGSAYKITRHRALHHGTCLLHSNNLAELSQLLHSPAKRYIQAKGVESVSSPVGNTGLSFHKFINHVHRAFEDFYGIAEAGVEHISVGEGALSVDTVKAGFEEMQTPEWTYGQTPQFTFRISSDSPLENRTRLQDNQRERVGLDLYLASRHGRINELTLKIGDSMYSVTKQNAMLYGWNGWPQILRGIIEEKHEVDLSRVAKFMSGLLPIAGIDIGLNNKYVQSETT